MANANLNPNLRYLEASVMSASPEELIIKVYDALLLFARQAIEVMESRPADIQGRHNILRRAQKACAVLMGSLRLDIESDIPGNLLRIYEFWHHELVGANMHGDPERVRAILPMIGGMRDTWVEAIKRFRVERGAAAAAAVGQLGTLVG